MRPNPAVSADLVLVRQELHRHDALWRGLLRARVWRPLFDILFDWALILGSVLAVHHTGGWLLLPALLVVGSRQRSLGNILHDAAHRNLSRHPRVNDLLAHSLVALPLLTDLARYREAHARHHAMLGDTQHDPDWIPPVCGPTHPWVDTFWVTLTQREAWMAALFGDLRSRLPLVRRAGMLAWWAVSALLVGLAAGTEVALLFLALWFGARMSTYHAITVFRELCDHFGLLPGGVFSFTRDICTASPLRWLVHPRNDGFHLTHHLMPAVPYHRLPQAQALLRQTAAYRLHGCLCDSYFCGPGAVIGTHRAVPAAV